MIRRQFFSSVPGLASLLAWVSAAFVSSAPREPILEDAKTVVAEQAEDEGLWFIPHTITEDILQRALRRLHAAVEGKTPEQCARAVLD